MATKLQRLQAEQSAIVKKIREINDLVCRMPADRTSIRTIFLLINQICLDILCGCVEAAEMLESYKDIREHNKNLVGRNAQLEYEMLQQSQSFQSQIAAIDKQLTEAEDLAAEYHANWMAAEIAIVNFIIRG